MLQNEQRFLLLKYSTALEKECIKMHKRVIDELGYCWFGKIGSVPSSKMLEPVFAEEKPIIILHKSNASYICESDAYSVDHKDVGVPSYYEAYDIRPTIYFRLLKIEKCDSSVFHNSIVCSTGTFVEDALFHARIPFMLCRYEDEKMHIPLGVNECRYAVDGFCTCRASVNYSCCCDRPSTCRFQRR